MTAPQNGLWLTLLPNHEKRESSNRFFEETGGGPCKSPRGDEGVEDVVPDAWGISQVNVVDRGVGAGKTGRGVDGDKEPRVD